MAVEAVQEPEPVSSGNKLTAPSTIPVEDFPADDCVLEPVIEVTPEPAIESSAEPGIADPLNDYLCALGEMPPGVTPSEAAIALIQKLQGQIVELQSSPAERAIPSLAKEAYELMVSRSTNPDASFKAWDEMDSFLRQVFEGRAASLAVDGLFEQCVREIQANA